LGGGKGRVNFTLPPFSKGLQVDEVVNMGQHAMHMSLVTEEM